MRLSSNVGPHSWSAATAYHQLGRFIVEFQAVGSLLNDVMALTSNSDEESVANLINELDYSSRLKAADVLFARFAGIHGGGDPSFQQSFHAVMVDLGRLGERRNELVHSSCHDWYDIRGSLGLLRRNSRLRGKAGAREEIEEELQPEAFGGDLKRLAEAAQVPETLRMKALEWRYPG